MHNFVYYNPTKVLFGKGTLQQIGSEASLLGNSVLLVTGKHFAHRSGLLRQVVELLQDAGLKVHVFSGVSPNPVLSHVREGVQQAKSLRAEVICGVGGGSAIDSAKAIAAGAVVEHDVWKFFTGKKRVQSPLPMLAVSTVAASGSEMNSGMVLTKEDGQQKFGFAHRLLYPRVAIMDPQLTFSVSPSQTAYGAIDTLAHLLEFYMTTQEQGTIVQDKFMEGLAIAVIDHCEQALAKPDNYTARAGLMWAAGLALNGLPSAGLGKIGFPMHLIEHSMSALFNIPHGAGLSIVIPAWLDYQADFIPERIAGFYKQIFATEGSVAGTCVAGTARLKTWFHQVGAPTRLQEVGIGAESVPALAANAQALARIWRMREYDEEVIVSVLERCL